MNKPYEYSSSTLFSIGQYEYSIFELLSAVMASSIHHEQAYGKQHTP
jgi:hypothetical protein